MEPVAHALGPEARNAVAEYFARLPSPPVPSRRAESEREAAAIVRGEAIARFGLPDQRVPACMECHGPDGPKRKPEYPLLAGQPAAYLQLQLGLFRENRRGGAAHAHLMQPITERLTPAQIQDVTLFFQSLGKSSEGGRRVLP
jgi:cytochrome c553